MHKKHGFTLIELLVVMGFITILAALWLSTLAFTKEQNQRTNCLSNLRQLYLACNTYACDNKEVLFEARPNSAAGATWVQISINPVCGLSGLPGMPRCSAMSCRSQTNTGKTIWSC